MTIKIMLQLIKNGIHGLIFLSRGEATRSRKASSFHEYRIQNYWWSTSEHFRLSMAVLASLLWISHVRLCCPQ